MIFKVKRVIISIDEIFAIVIISSIFSVHIMAYLKNYYMCFLFIIFHELSHMFVASLFGKKISGASVTLSGLCINYNIEKRGGYKWLIIFLAGPLANLLLAVMFCNINFIFQINISLAIINMIPIFPLDRIQYS